MTISPIDPVDSTLGRTASGWPLLGPNSYVDAVPAYTADLAAKLENADADVAAAINAADRAELAAARFGTGVRRTTSMLTVGSGASAQITFSTVEYDDDPSREFFTLNADGSITVLRAGRYTVAGKVQLAENIATGRREFVVYSQAGSTWKPEAAAKTPGSNAWAATVQATTQLPAGAKVSAWVFQDTGANRTLVPLDTWLSVTVS